jgi:hypothetical protein
MQGRFDGSFWMHNELLQRLRAICRSQERAMQEIASSAAG